MSDEMSKFLREAIVDGQECSIAFAKKMVDETPEIEVKFLKEEPIPIKLESQARNHTFYDEDVCAEYLKKYGSKNTVILADIGEQVIQCVLDEKAPTGFEILTLKPKIHPLFEPYANLPMVIQAKDFAAFIMRQRRDP